MPSETIYKKTQGVSSRQLGAELMLYDQHNDKVHVLNETGALIWSLLDGKTSLQDINHTFTRQFPDTPQDQINGDIKEVIQKLEKEGLIKK